MLNYQNGKIYKIEDVGGNMCYIGSATKDFLRKLMVQHKCMYKKWQLDNTVSKYSVFNFFEAMGNEN